MAGGVTTLACPPDVDPIIDEPELAERIVKREVKKTVDAQAK